MDCNGHITWSGLQWPPRNLKREGIGPAEDTWDRPRWKGFRVARWIYKVWETRVKGSTEASNGAGPGRLQGSLLLEEGGHLFLKHYIKKYYFLRRSCSPHLWDGLDQQISLDINCRSTPLHEQITPQPLRKALSLQYKTSNLYGFRNISLLGT